MREPPHSIGPRLQQERLRLKFESVGACAQACGISAQRLAALEGGSMKLPDVDELAYLANVGFDLNYLLTAGTALPADEAALVDNYRAASPSHKSSLRQVGAAFAQPVDEGEGGAAAG